MCIRDRGGGGVTLLFNCLFLTGYLSLVRRVRSGTLWTNSVLNLLVSAARKALRGRKATTKMMLSYGSFLLLNLLFLCLGFLGLFLAVLFDVGVGVFLLRQAVPVSYTHLGPEGGDRGGTVIAKGTPEEVAEQEISYTGQYLRKYLKK